MTQVKLAGVLGAGTMGSRIAAHFANAGVPVLLLDVVLPGQADRSAAAKRGVETAALQSPGAFFGTAGKTLITAGNFEDDLPLLSDCDWIVEAVAENLDIKRELWSKITAIAKTGAILSTNTSGIQLAAISENFPASAARFFLGNHFFNPPRYLHLVELIPGPKTGSEVLAFVAEFCDRRLGKGVVVCKDTPNFIANRIGSFFGASVCSAMVEGDHTIEEVDALTGPLIGVPKSASFRLFDLIGIDVWASVARNLYQAVPEDPWRERFVPPSFLNEMLKRGWLGEKSGQGFYKRTGKDREIHAMDWKTFEYHPAARVRFAELETVVPIETLGERVRALVRTGGRGGNFVWNVLADVFLYTAERVPEISDRIVEIDRAMRWGYGHQMGPFELWDAIGFDTVAERMETEGRSLPPLVREMRRVGAPGFYRTADRAGRPLTEYFDLATASYSPIERRPGMIVLAEMKRAKGVVRKNAGASLVDVGDGVLCLEFHSKMNALGEDAITMLHQALEETDRNFEAMVIANQGEHFSAGANLMMLLLAAQEGDWDELNEAVRRFQDGNMAVKCASKPVVAAPFSRVLGGGAEMVLHCRRAQASAETYMGLVETGVGLIPAGGGCKEMLLRVQDPKLIFEVIGMAKVSTSAGNAREMGLLRDSDGISMNPERLIDDAKTAALALVATFAPVLPRSDIPVSGAAGYAQMKLAAWSMRQAEFISDHDQLIGEKLAGVLSGGRLSGEPAVSEQYLLDLEREAFLSLLGTAKTQDRIAHMLKTGKPLRN